MRLDLHGDIHIHLHTHADKTNEEILKTILDNVIINQKKLTPMAVTVDQILQDVQDEATLEGSIIALLSGFKQQLADALSGVELPVTVQAKVDTAFAALETNKAALAAAITANSPAPVDPTPVVPVEPTPTEPVAGS